MFLLTEAMRGAGAKLLNVRGERFMEKYNSEWKELAPRDVVSRSIHQEMELTRSDHVYLDLKTARSHDEIVREFPFLYKQCKLHGVDITRDLVPVVPAAHYFCGGVWVDINGRTTIDNLYAVGEVSCAGVHGANRLASTSLLEGLVWGVKAAESIVNDQQTMLFNKDYISPWSESSNETADPALILQDMTVIRHIMWNYVGLVRTTHRLQRAIRELRNLEIEIERFYRAVRISDELIGLRNAVRASNIITMAAWENKSSLGCHFRES
jgi:L-aspartate oxidase